MPKTLATQALKTLPANAPTLQKKLLESLVLDIPQADVDIFDKDLLLKMASAQWRLAKKRAGGHPRIEVYCDVSKTKKLRRTVIDIVSDDMAFLVDSVAAEINRHGLLINFLSHPIFYAQYDDKDNLVDISTTPKKGYIRQSHIHVHIKDTVSDDVLAHIEKELWQALNDVYVSNRDWRKMLHKLEDARRELSTARTKIDPKEIEKFCAFLDYLHDNNFTLLGYREYEFIEGKNGLESKTIKGQSLGLLHDDVRPAYINESEERLPRNLQEIRRKLPAVSISKTNAMSTVHRRVPMDAIAIKTYDVEGNIKGEKLFLGLFTSVTYSRSVADVPYLREKVEAVMTMSNFLPQSHDRKGLRHILEKYPRDELFQIPEKDLYDIGISILRLQERQRVALFIRRDPFGRYVSCLVYIPRDRFGSNLRRRIGKILERELNGKISNFFTSLDDSVFARVMFMMKVDQKNPPKFKPQAIEILLQEEAQTWQERLGVALADQLTDEDEILHLTLKYGEAFPIDYTSKYKAKNSVFDLFKVEETLKQRTLQLDLYVNSDDNGGQLRLKVYSPASPIILSDVMPLLADLGLRAISELPFEITPANADISVWIHDFHLELEGGGHIEKIARVKDKFETAFTKIWYGKIDSDPLNALVLKAAADWDEIVILRTYVRYLKQIKYPFGQIFIEKTLTSNSKIASLLIGLFKAQFDPSLKPAKAQENIAAYDAAIETELEHVVSLDQDRILRSMKSLITNTLRTNFFQKDEKGERKDYLSIKLDSTKILDLPQPRPYRETYVYSRRTEGVHLRGDKIARGGIRWSDRHEDYRTEILGLMKAQMVKNSVIVPMGAKGGFVVKSDIKDRNEFRKEGVECYKILVRGLLDIVDNLKGTKVIPPKDVVRRDGDDPYLVVAADKGTATFSDIANSLSQGYKFWLDDAFASGGSAGYDHKKMGITARGAWESVKLHFRHLNHNTQTKDFDVIGVGDMGGDVFGNGMILSKHIRLVGAFNHVHIFCDPDPDLEVSFKERKRLFKAVQGWDGYDISKLSEGGRIYSRDEKVLKLTPQIQKRFGIEKDKVSPLELMNSMLKARTDLLWFGGIGTYIKAKSETDLDVGDKANDPIRVYASEVQAKVIAEGANLGVTQRGRIEFAERGGRINTDFLDNSGGVDSSDHEVNIKILLSDIMSKPSNKMSLAARNKLLESMTEEVAAHVLWNNYQQAQAISLAEIQAAETLKLQEDFIQQLERHHGFNRKGEGLPDQEEIERRVRLNKGLTRPELCILLSHAKIRFTQDLLASDLPDQAESQSWLIQYFPEALQKNFKKDISNHRLRREIIATRMASSMVNRMGPTFVLEQVKKTGASNADIARAYMAVREVFGLRALWDEIEALDNQVPAEVQLKAMRATAELAQHAVTWFLTRMGRKIDMSRDVAAYMRDIEILKKNLGKLVSSNLADNVKERQNAHMRDGLPEKLALQIAYLPTMASACDIIRIAQEQKTSVLETAKVYFELGSTFYFEWLRRQARFMDIQDYWQSEARDGLVDQLYSAQAGLCVHVVSAMKAKKKTQDIAKHWFKDRTDAIYQHQEFFKQLRNGGNVELPQLVLAVQRLRSIYGG